MSERERAARSIGFLEGFGAVVWMFVGEELADEYAADYDAHVETLRKALLAEQPDEEEEEDV